MDKSKVDQIVPDDTIEHGSAEQGFHVHEGVKHLNSLQLAEFTRAFEQWHKETVGPATRRARGRVWLTFLVLRFSGARLGETLSLDDQTDFDPGQGLLHLRKGSGGARTIQLPQQVSLEFQAIVDNPEYADLRGKLFKMDQGHVRRKFQEVGALCGLPKDLSNPTALRRSRAIELLRSEMPLKVVQRILGQGSANLAANFFDISDNEVKRIVNKHIHAENTRKMSARNTFFGKISRIVSGDIQSQVEITTIGGYTINSIITNGSLKSMGFKKDDYATAIVKAPWVVLSKNNLAPMSSASNKLLGKISEIQRGKIASEVTVELADGINVCAVITEDSATSLDLHLGENIWAMFSSSSVIVILE